MTIRVNLLTRGVTRDVTISDIKYHITLNTIFSVVSVTCVILSLALFQGVCLTRTIDNFMISVIL